MNRKAFNRYWRQLLETRDKRYRPKYHPLREELSFRVRRAGRKALVLRTEKRTLVLGYLDDVLTLFDVALWKEGNYNPIKYGFEAVFTFEEVIPVGLNFFE